MTHDFVVWLCIIIVYVIKFYMQYKDAHKYPCPGRDSFIYLSKRKLTRTSFDSWILQAPACSSSKQTNVTLSKCTHKSNLMLNWRRRFSYWLHIFTIKIVRALQWNPVEQNQRWQRIKRVYDLWFVSFPLLSRGYKKRFLAWEPPCGNSRVHGMQMALIGRVEFFRKTWRRPAPICVNQITRNRAQINLHARAL